MTALGGHVSVHVDDFIDNPDSDAYAAAWFGRFRRPAMEKLKAPDHSKLFATYKGKRYRVTGCSRLGDVWLSSDFNEDTTYEKRVDVADCSNWSNKAHWEQRPMTARCRAIRPPITDACGKPATHIVTFPDDEKAAVCEPCGRYLVDIGKGHGSIVKMEKAEKV